MTENELKKLNRAELLELLLEQERENNRLRLEIRDLKGKLEDRDIKLVESGNIADAALRIHNVFEAAQAAAETYLHNIKKNAGVSPEPAPAPQPATETTDPYS